MSYRAIVDPTRWVQTLSADVDVLYDSSRVLSDGSTGTGTIVHSQSPTIVTPTIASFTNAQHSHQNAAGGGTLDAAAIAAGTLPVARGGTGNTTGTATVNANLTGPITSVGNATSVASQTGTGSKFVMDTGPSITSPNVTDGALLLKSAQIMSFCLQIANNGGTIQHRVFDNGDSLALGNYAGKVSGASATYANTPSVDSTHDFTSGAGIDASANFIAVLKTAAQTNADTLGIAVVESDVTGAGTTRAQLRNRSLNVNGTTRNYFGVSFLKPDGSGFALTTANIPSGTWISVRVLAFIL